MSLTSDEVNFLIYRYMLESGFQHSAFTFGAESTISKSSINGENVPAGALITFIQKGLQYIEVESQLNDSDLEAEAQQTLDLLRPQVKRARTAENSDTGNAAVKGEVVEEVEEEDRAQEESDVGAGLIGGGMHFESKDVATLEGHEKEVFICAWNPKKPLIASGSSDSTARIWPVMPSPGSSDVQPHLDGPIVLEHTEDSQGPAPVSRDVTTLDWNCHGSMLATGSYDGSARIWNDRGVLLNTLSKHIGPIFSLKWNKKGDCLLSGSVDKTAIVWDPLSGVIKQQFEFHTEPTLDVDWKDNTTFATCSTDKKVFVCELGKTEYVRKFEGHEDEVNAIKWCPRGRLLASCSDDWTAKIWSMNSSKFMLDLREHQKEIYTIKWSPTGPGTANPNLPLVLASASFDSIVKIWDVEKGKRIHDLCKHTDSVYSVAFSPDGQYLASGSSDHCLHIWSAKDGSLVKTYTGNGGIFEVCWNSRGNKVAACFSNNTLGVIDLRK